MFSGTSTVSRVEALEYAFPVRVEQYSLRRGSGGAGRCPGGDGLRRDTRFLVPARVTVLSERRRRAPWGLAGLWKTWVDRTTGELVESYTMLTLNADHHPLMRRMHKPDPKLPPDRQDKRSVIPVEFEDVDLWLHGTIAEARRLLRLSGADRFDAAPAALDSRE